MVAEHIHLIKIDLLMVSIACVVLKVGSAAKILAVEAGTSIYQRLVC
jgi:hypothetical protein